MDDGSNNELTLPDDIKSKDELINRYSAVVYSAVIKTLQTHQSSDSSFDADDLVQEVFLRLFKDDARLLSTYNSEKAALSTWLTIVARSTVISKIRKKRVQTISLEPEKHAQKQSSESRIAEPPTTIIPANLLSTRQQLVLKLLFDEEQEVRQIAKTLQITEQTVRSCKHKALAKLRKFLIN